MVRMEPSHVWHLPSESLSLNWSVYVHISADVGGATASPSCVFEKKAVVARFSALSSFLLVPLCEEQQSAEPQESVCCDMVGW